MQHTVSTLLMDTSTEQTTRVGTFSLSLLLLFDSLQGPFPFVRTDRPDRSRLNENFTFNQNYSAQSVKSQKVCTREKDDFIC